jgi:hypothetical protein
MVMWIVVIVSVIILIAAADQLGLWLERKGWIYYRKKKGSGGNSSLSGGIVTQFQGIFDPQTHVLEEVQLEEEMTQVEKGYSGDKDDDSSEEDQISDQENSPT